MRGSHVLADLKMLVRYAVGVPRFLRQPLTPDECRHAIERQLENREHAFLAILQRGVFENARSPYRRLCEHIGIDYGDIARLVCDHGLERTLDQLYDAGVHVSLEESRGHRPLVRGALELPVRPRDFENPLLVKHYEARSGGSRSPGRRAYVDLDTFAQNATYESLLRSAFALEGHPTAIWRATPPAIPGLAAALTNAKLRQPVERWFSQARFPGLRFPKQALMIGYAVYGSRLWGTPLPVPEHTPPADAVRVARWLAEKTESGTPGRLITTPSSGVRVCLAAREHDLDIRGAFFRFAGEPFTPARAEVVSGAGCRAGCNYYMTEVGQIGVACAAPSAPDEVHAVTDGVAVLQRDRQVPGGATVGALLYTTLRPSSPKIMINVESDDYGQLSERGCGCLLDEVGLSTHLHTIRSYEKLTSEGMNFLGSDVIDLVDQVLPQRFGGAPTDYQLVEQEDEDGLPRVGVVVSPRVGTVDESEILETTLRFLRGRGQPQEMMTDVWQAGGTVRVIRREPYTTGAHKLLPLHLLDAGRSRLR
jgi:hypothetical protein